jgi:molybdopterin converting factor small subunit
MNGDGSTLSGREDAAAEGSCPVVTARFFADLSDLFGSFLELRLDGLRDVARLVELLSDTPLRRRALLDQHGGNRIAILVNGRNVAFLDGESTRLSDGDLVDFFPPVFGG